jgi:hypothetical protein
MRKLTGAVFQSLDGVMQAPDGQGALPAQGPEDALQDDQAHALRTRY